LSLTFLVADFIHRERYDTQALPGPFLDLPAW